MNSADYQDRAEDGSTHQGGIMSVIVTHAENKSDDYGQVLTVTVLRTHAIYIRPCPYAEDYPRDLIEGLAEWAKGAMS